MSLKQIQLTVNDSLPNLRFRVSRSGDNSTTPNLEGFTVSHKVREQSATSNSFVLTVTSSGGDDGQITDPDSGIILLQYSTGNFSSTGTFSGETSMESAGGKTETAPDRQSYIVRGEF